MAPVSASSIEAAVSLLASVGVGTVPDGGGERVQPVSNAILDILMASVEIMASNAAAGIGFHDTSLDDLISTGTAEAVRAWSATGSSRAALAAAALSASAASSSDGPAVTTPLALALYLADGAPRSAVTGSATPIRFASLRNPAGNDGRALADLPTLCDPYIANLGSVLSPALPGTSAGPDLAAILLLLDILPVLESGTDRWFEVSPPTNSWTVPGGPGRTGTVTLHATTLIDQYIQAYVPCIDPVPPSGAVEWTFIGAGNAIVASEDDLLQPDATGATAALSYAMSREQDGATVSATSMIGVLAGYDQLELSQLEAVILPLLAQAPSNAALLGSMFARLEADASAGPLLGMRPITIPVVYHVCGASDPCASPATSSTPSGIGGTWTGSWTSAVYAGLAGAFTLNFSQTGHQLTGTIQISGSPCISTGAVTGTLNGNVITFGAVQGAETVAYTGTWSGQSLNGLWQVTASSGGECTADNGEWQAQR